MDNNLYCTPRILSIDQYIEAVSFFNKRNNALAEQNYRRIEEAVKQEEKQINRML